MSVVTDEHVEEAILFLAKSAGELADARATLVGLEEGRKSLKAKLMREQNGGTVSDRENAAYAHPDYEELVSALVAATKRAEHCRLRRENALTLIEVWRTAQANNRALERIR